MNNNNAYSHFTSQQIKPAGWLKRQLEIQAAGLSGNLDKIWPDIRDSAWIGGKNEGWERVPYWLDGFIPLAFLLDNEDMKSRARKYIDAIISRQKPDGWICPCEDDDREYYDVWATFLICKVLVLYHDCTDDNRIEGVVSSALKNLQNHLQSHTLFNWGQSRWFECMIPVLWLYDRTGEEWLTALALTLSTQGLDYKRLFDSWKDQEPRREWSFQTHIVNLMMALKSEALFSGISGEEPDSFAEKMFSVLSEYHGSAIGHINGDECLAGKSPIHGTELCSIVEALFSFETLFEITGNSVWMDRADQLAFNSLPATLSEDMWTHQYLQLVNQISCTKQNEPPVFYTNSSESNLFGLEPNYGCCTANFNQAWPKLALSAYYRSKNGIVSAVTLPSKLACNINGIGVHIALETDYPFGGILKYTVETDSPVEFSLGIRIPSTACRAHVDGIAVDTGRIYTVRRRFEGKSEINVRLEFTAELIKQPEGGYCLQRGPLFYAVPVKTSAERHEYVSNGVERKFPYCDYELHPESEWEYGFTNQDFSVTENGIGKYPFSRSEPPISISARLAKIRWETLPGQPGVCNPLPADTTPVSYKTVALQPYGCTSLRMTVLPLIK